ncbi:cupin domain-containing protein [Shewanella eurypsychrophilus]|uniref:Cupin domain-containing protein n=1 Tax=Shewanella eurypsychrophilus TaxID=2593656 RepID=A0ABX6V9L5_9GAMM|nr:MULTISPECIES: cupin domain-containing protein [Shewanella]QFU24109.1 cupin domain-containing protein [Shewanella sp. YLB-09]QPG59316.1 cupin domain-containing protein [Shewanella eurypsychrophilus]
MYLTNESEHDYRFGDYGPKYLTNGPRVDFGIVVITPGEAHPCHKHVTQEESFLVLEGECTVYVDGEPVLIKEGDYLRCEPGESHQFSNESDSNFKAVFVKAAHCEIKDSVYIDWQPGQPFLKEE